MRLMCVLCKIFGGDNMFLHLSVAELVPHLKAGTPVKCQRSAQWGSLQKLGTDSFSR